jgi:2-amino-4-hydroxy-6-hydroxymethyldihydropteridine diphosphokinase
VAKLTLSLGSNLGDRTTLLDQARERIVSEIGPVSYASDMVTTAAWGRTEQPDFLNQLLVIELDGARWPPRGEAARHTVHRLLDRCQAIEADLGRVRRMPWGPRTIDIDIIFLDDLVLETERISLPHPWWRQRTFVIDLLPDRSVLAR